MQLALYAWLLVRQATCKIKCYMRLALFITYSTLCKIVAQKWSCTCITSLLTIYTHDGWMGVRGCSCRVLIWLWFEAGSWDLKVGSLAGDCWRKFWAFTLFHNPSPKRRQLKIWSRRVFSCFLALKENSGDRKGWGWSCMGFKRP